MEDVATIFSVILLPYVVQLYEFHGKSEKLKKTKHRITTKKEQIRLCRKNYRELIVMHTGESHSEPSQTSKMEPFTKMVNYFAKIFILGADYMQIFSPGGSFNLLNRGKISSCMLSDNDVKIELRLYSTTSSR